RWTVVAQVPHDIVYAPVYALRRVIAIAVAVAIVVALLSSIVLAQQLTSPLTQLSRFAEALSRRDFESKVTVRTSDELGLLGDVMTRAAEDLQTSEEKILAEEAIRADLRRYLPGDLVDKVVSREQNMALGGERRDVSVLFADVVSFTPLAQKLDPEDVVEILNDLFTIVTEIVFRHGGTVDKFIGDCVMAMWGAPGAMEHHAAAALEAAEEIKSWLEAGNARWQSRFGITVEVAIGVNSGSAVVGNVGSKTRMEYTAIGETVNVAARLEAIARPMQILLTDETRARAGEGFTFVPAGERTLAGREEPITLWELVS
ncbi:MAG: adenylate/guanylate cyclase domain-containing protein, partial [Myxococcota bacterium]